MSKTILFVYGSLKRGERANRLLAGQRFLGEAVTIPHYRLVDLGAYPGLVREPENGLAVTGELWEVDASCLAELDAYEDVPRLYTREPVRLLGRGDEAEAYFSARPIPPGARSGASWPLPG